MLKKVHLVEDKLLFVMIHQQKLLENYIKDMQAVLVQAILLMAVVLVIILQELEVEVEVLVQLVLTLLLEMVEMVVQVFHPVLLARQ